MEWSVYPNGWEQQSNWQGSVLCMCVLERVYTCRSVQLTPGGIPRAAFQSIAGTSTVYPSCILHECCNLMCRRFGMGKCDEFYGKHVHLIKQRTLCLKFILNCATTNSFLRVLPYAMHACRLQPWRAISFALSRTRNHECRNKGSKCVCSLCCISSQAVKGTLPSVDSSKESPNRLHSRTYAK